MAQIKITVDVTGLNGVQNVYEVVCVPAEGGGVEMRPSVVVQTQDQTSDAAFKLRIPFPAAKFTNLASFFEALTPERAQKLVEKLQAISILFLK